MEKDATHNGPRVALCYMFENGIAAPLTVVEVRQLYCFKDPALATVIFLCLNAVNTAYRVLPLEAQAANRSSEHKSNLLERVARPENAEALATIRKIDELMTVQGRRIVEEFHRADTNRSGEVSGKMPEK